MKMFSPDKYRAKITYGKFNPGKTGFVILLFALTGIYLYPFYIVLVISLKLPHELLFDTLAFPRAFHFENFAVAWQRMDYATKFMNSFFITVFSVLGIAFISGMGSFTLAKRQNKTYTFIYYFFIAGLMIPFYMTLTSLMKLMRDLYLINSLWGLVLMNIGRSLPFSVLLYVGFIRGVPNEIIDSANIDGCTPFRCYFRIVFPMVKTVTSTVIILNVLSIWNDFLMPLLMLTRSKKQTIPVILRTFWGESQNEWNLTFAAFLLSMLPLMIFYFILQKSIVEGVAAGALKG
jgi:raffinose/stachyose/melibiose transport system permease protein